jgi:uroporphyrinogen decarboxylase
MTNPYFAQHRLIRAFLRQPVDVTPVWLMRQAGRYLPEYRKSREKAGDFLTLCKTPELACEVTLQPLARFPLDGAIIFSDILTIPDAMGLGLYFAENEGPKFLNPLKNAKDVEKLGIPDPETELRYVMEAIRLTKTSLQNKLPLIGFSGSPWTLATYMTEARKMAYQAPHSMDQLIEKLSETIVLYLNAQIKAGADALMIFDTWGGELTTQAYHRYSILPIKNIIAKLNRESEYHHIPIVVFTKHGGQWLKKMLTMHCDVVGIDWTTSISRARKQIGHAVAIQGNIDPAVLYATPEVIEKEVEKVLAAFGHHAGHIFNLGHGIPKDVPVENVAALVESVHTLSKKYHD